MTGTDRALRRDFVWRMISLCKAYRRYAGEELERSGLSHTAALLVMLLNDTRGDCSQKFLADHLDIAPASLVPLLKQIEAFGLIVRRQAPDDKRVNNIELTAKGEILAKEARRVLDNLRQRLFANLASEDVAAALRVMEGLQSALAVQKSNLK